ncbi:MAG TPA: DMT family transporter [Fontimonas sp.]
MNLQFGLGELYSLICAFTWASAVIVFKKSGEHLPPFALNLVKNAIVLPMFLLTLLAFEDWQWPAIPAPHIGILLLSGVLGIAMGDTLYFRALNAIGASRMAAAQALYSPFVILLSLTVLGERLGGLQFAGVALVLGGIGLVTWSPAQTIADRRLLWAGVAWAVLAVFMMAVGVVMAKPMLEQHSFLWVVTLRIVGGLLGMLGLAAARREFASLWRAWRGVTHWHVIVLGGFIGTYVSMMFWLAGYKYTQASIAAVLNELAAAFILPLAAIFLRERIQPRQTLGVLVALVGVLLVVTMQPAAA